ncbi:MAG: peptidoglycan-binding protein, partial [Candidatus Binatia bacterium]
GTAFAASLVLFVALSFLGFKACSNPSEPVTGIQPYAAQTSEIPGTSTEDMEEASSELRLENVKLQQKLTAAEVLSIKLEQQLADLQTLSTKLEQQIATAQPLSPKLAQQPAQSQVSAPEAAALPEQVERTEPTVSEYRRGDRGPTITRIQKQLQMLGYYSGKANGIFDRKTRGAVRTFQRNERLPADGVVGPRTLRRLLLENPKPFRPAQRLAAAQPLSATLDRQLTDARPSARETGTPPEAIEQPESMLDRQFADFPPSAQAMAAPPEEIERTEPVQSRYKLGDQGPMVARIQRRLHELGYYTDEVDGFFDSKTRNAVQAFQRNEKLGMDGRVGGRTLQRLFSPQGKLLGGRVL